MRILRLFLCLILLVAMSSGIAMSQACPNGKTAFIWMNGIHGVDKVVNGVLVPGATLWANSVRDFNSAYQLVHPNIDPSCIMFDNVFNHHGFAIEDLAQTGAQWIFEAINQVDFSDPDFVTLIDRIRQYSGNGYRVVLVGHSQGTYYTNFAYEAIRDKKVLPIPTIPSLPDPTKLSIVNIASAADHVADGNGRYTTQCGDIIYLMPGSLPSNINNNGSAGCSAGLGVHPVDLHQLDSYLATTSLTQLQIYADLDLAANLPDPGCGGDVSCYLKDNFYGYYGNNFRMINDPYSAQNSTVDTASNLGTLRMDSRSFTATSGVNFSGWLALRTRRVFTGPFTISLKYNSFGTNGTNCILLANVKDNTVAAIWVLAPIASNTTWYPLTFTKTDTQITMYVNGNSQGSVSTTVNDSYYLAFSSYGDNTLQIQNLSVSRGATTPPSPMLASCMSNPATITAGQATVFSGASSGGTGVRTGVWGGVVSGSNFTATYSTLASTPAGIGKATYTVTDSGTPQQVIVATCQVQINAVPPPTPTMTLTPATNTVSVVQGNPVTVNLVLTSKNGMTGNPNITLYCSVSCPVGFSYNYTSGSTRTLLANGTIPISATFTPSSSSTLGTSNFQYWAVLGSLTVKATIAVNVTVASPTTTGTVVVSTTSSIGVNCNINGAYVSAPTSLSGQLAGSKTLACTAPIGYTINTITPSSTQNLVAGGTITFTVNLVVSMPAPVLNSVTVNTQPKVNLPISISLFGSNFVNGAFGYTCTSTQTNTCTPWTTTYVNSGQLNLTFQRSTAGTVYLLVINPDSKISGFLTMVVIN